MKSFNGGKKCLVWPIWLGIAALCAVLVGGGCSGSTDPGDGGETITISFNPVAQGQEVDLGATLGFSVTAPKAAVLNVNWWRNGIVDRRGTEYTYVPAVPGVDTLRAQAEADGVTDSYFWVINVKSTGNSLPPAVPAVAAGPGPAPGDVLVSWMRAGPSAYPVVAYQVAISYTGVITEANWASARMVREVPNEVGRVGYEENLTVAGEQMVPGADAWFAVRALDEIGQMSPVATNGFTTITTGWWLNGVVRDDRDALLVGATVRSADPDLSTNTDVNGLFSLGPFRSIDRAVLTTATSNAAISGWFDFQSGEIDSVSGRDYEIVLIRRYVLDAECDLYGGQFLNYLRVMTRTEFDVTDPANTVLHRWDTYPLRAYVPDLVNSTGVDFGEAARFAMAYWDSVMGEAYFAAATDEAAAEVVFVFDDSRPNFNGQVSLLEPSGPDINLGDVVPEKVESYLNTTIATQKFAREVALHELGHVLGLLSHSACRQSGYLMVAGASGNLSNPDPIHPDEQNAARCVRRLPREVDMAGYSVSR